jgi:4-hydroxysphinganine ceramide fatty acyl 2-hydroxylase
MIETLSLFGLGWLLWTFLEYALHGWLGHWPKGRLRFARQHLQHHATTDYFFPFVEKFRVFLPLIALVVPGAMALFGLELGLSFSLGTLSGWLFQEIVHRRLHTHAPRTAYGRWARRHHLHHHFANPKRNHGITTSLWDHVFRTYERPALITVPRKQAPRLPWLLADGQPEVATLFAGDYRIA